MGSTGAEEEDGMEQNRATEHMSNYYV